MEKINNILVCKAVKFYSHKDEDMFFKWIKKIDCIDETSAAYDELYLHIASDELHDNDLRDIIALFYRYKIDMKQLKKFLNKKNKEWFFDNLKAYWHKHIFG